MKKIFIMIVACLMCVSMIGCGGSSTPEADSIKIEDIDWKVKEGFSDFGNRILLLDYKNNSDYTIVEFQIKFTLKKDITNKQLSVLDDVKKQYNWSNDYAKNVYISASNQKFCEPGKEIKSIRVGFNNTYQSVSSMDQYNLTEPDMLSLIIMKDDKLYLNYYDFKSKSYSQNEKSGIDAFTWSEGELAKLIEKPDVKIGQVNDDSDDRFAFTCYGVSDEYFKEYIEKCKSKGFTVDSDSSEIRYEAKNSDGYKLSLWHGSENENMTISVTKD